MRGGHERVDMLRARMEPANGRRAGLRRHPQPRAGSGRIPLPALSTSQCYRATGSSGAGRIQPCSPCRGRSKRIWPSKCMAPWRRPSQSSHRLRGPLLFSCWHSTWWHTCGRTRQPGTGCTGGCRQWHAGGRDGQHHEQLCPPLPIPIRCWHTGRGQRRGQSGHRESSMSRRWPQGRGSCTAEPPPRSTALSRDPGRAVRA